MSDRTIAVLMATALILAAGAFGYLIGSAVSRRRFTIRAMLALMFAVAVAVAVIAAVERL